MASVRHPLDARLLDVLPVGSVFAVGGRVRDEFRGRLEGVTFPPKDLDYVVTGLAFAELEVRLAEIGRVDLVGASFAVVKLTAPEGQADIALPRREQSTGVGHSAFTVESGPAVSLEDDLGRRDFRMNMIARELGSDRIVDPHDGVRDVAARRIDIVTARAFEDDPLRMLRAAQFAARFDFEVSAEVRRAMSAAAALVTTVSAERVGEELAKLFVLAKRPSVGLELLRETDVLAQLWPEMLEGVGVDQNEWHAYDVYRHNLVTLDATPPGDLVLRLAALLHDVGKPRTKDGPHFYRHEHVGADMVPAMLARLRLSTETVTTVARLVRQHMYTADPELQPKALRRFVQRVGREHLGRLFALRAADVLGSGLPKRSDENERFEARVAAIVAEAPPFAITDLAISGSDVIGLLVQAGRVPADFLGDRRVGAVLRALFEFVTDDPRRNVRTTLLAEAMRSIEEGAAQGD